LEHHFAVQERAFRLYGLFIDRRFGLGRWAPLLLLVLPALPLMLAGRVRALACILILAQLSIATFLAITMMGYWFPGRTLMTVLPLFALVIATALIKLPVAMRWVTGALGVLTLLTTVSLAYAVRYEGIRLAFDPYAMDTPGFQALGRVFPNYQTWSLETVVLTFIWLALFVSGAVWATAQSPAIRSWIYSWQTLRPSTLRTPVRVGSSTAPPP
jgi:hypothetical protein